MGRPEGVRAVAALGLLILASGVGLAVGIADGPARSPNSLVAWSGLALTSLVAARPVRGRAPGHCQGLRARWSRLASNVGSVAVGVRRDCWSRSPTPERRPEPRRPGRGLLPKPVGSDGTSGRTRWRLGSMLVGLFGSGGSSWSGFLDPVDDRLQLLEPPPGRSGATGCGCRARESSARRWASWAGRSRTRSTWRSPRAVA